MEKTLKERIKDYADDLFSLIDKHKKYEFEIDEFRLIIEETAESFATEQKEIDDKAAFEERGKAFKAGYDTAIEEALKAFCKTHGCGIPHSTCTSLGTCDEYDTFNRELTKAMEG